MTSTVILSDNGVSSGSAGLKSTAGNDGVLILQTTTSSGTATNAVYVDNLQNMGVSVTPSGTAGAWKSIELAQAGSGLVAGYGETDFVNNLKADRVGAFSWSSTGYAGRFNLSAGVYSWSAGTGSAGNQFVANGHITQLNTNGVLVLSGGNASATGVGIAFPSTQVPSTDANTLDDYEEGTWTPTFFAPCGYTISAIASSVYTKIGNTVFVQAYFTVSGTGNSTSLAFAGLPFNAGGQNYCTGAVDIGVGGVLGTYARVEANASYVQLLYSGGGVTGSTSVGRIPLAANQTGAGYFIFSLTYSLA